MLASFSWKGSIWTVCRCCTKNRWKFQSSLHWLDPTLWIFFFPKRGNSNICIVISGEMGLGKASGKPLHYKGSFFHRIIKGFMIQVFLIDCCTFTFKNKLTTVSLSFRAATLLTTMVLGENQSMGVSSLMKTSRECTQNRFCCPWPMVWNILYRCYYHSPISDVSPT